MPMECSAVLQLSALPLQLTPQKPDTGLGGYPSTSRSWNPTRTSSLSLLPTNTRLHCHKMFVPGFGEASPEAKAASNLHDFFTYVAVKIVSSQLESYNPEAYQELMDFLGKHTLNDGDEFCSHLMRESPRHKNLALRILEVRSAYCKKDFEWDNLKRLTFKIADDSNTRIMRDYVLETSNVEGEEI